MRACAASGAESALGIEQEDTGDNDLLTFTEAIANLDAVGQLCSYRHGPWLETIPLQHEHVLFAAGVHHCIARY